MTTASSTGRHAAVPAPAAPLSEGRLRLLLIVMCGALALVIAANSSLNVALPDIARDLGATQTELTWVVNGYALLFAALLLPAGIAADRFGRRPALVAGLLVFGLSSVVSAFVDSPGTLIALRVVAGIGATLVMPATLSVLTDAYPPERRAYAVGIWAGVSGAGAVLGLVAGGVLLTWFWWGSVLAVSGVASVALAGVCAAAVPAHRNPSLSLDPLGSTAAVLTLGSLVYGIIEGPERGWTDPLTVTAFVVAVLSFLAFVAVELRVADPMLDVRLFRHRGLSVGSTMIVLQFAAALGLFVLIPQYLQSVRGESALESALRLLPLALGIGPGSQLAPKLSARFGDRIVVTAGMAVAGGGFLLLGSLPQDGAYWPFALALALFGAGFGLATTPATTLILEGLPADRRTLASAVNDTAREVGGAIGIAVLATVLNAVYRERADTFTAGLPADAAELGREGVGVAVAVADRLGPAGTQLAESARAGFYDGYQVSILTGAAILLAGAVFCALFAPRRSGPAVDPARSGPAEPADWSGASGPAAWRGGRAPGGRGDDPAPGTHRRP